MRWMATKKNIARQNPISNILKIGIHSSFSAFHHIFLFLLHVIEKENIDNKPFFYSFFLFVILAPLSKMKTKIDQEFVIG